MVAVGLPGLAEIVTLGSAMFGFVGAKEILLFMDSFGSLT